MPRTSLLPHARTTVHEVPSSASDLGLERLGTGLMSLIRDGRRDRLSLRQLAVLALLVSTPGPHTIRGCAAILGIARSVTTRAVDRLELEGLARRLPDPRDGRSVLVQATRKGADTVRAAGAAFA